MTCCDIWYDMIWYWFLDQKPGCRALGEHWPLAISTTRTTTKSFPFMPPSSLSLHLLPSPSLSIPPYLSLPPHPSSSLSSPHSRSPSFLSLPLLPFPASFSSSNPLPPAPFYSSSPSFHFPHSPSVSLPLPPPPCAPCHSLLSLVLSSLTSLFPLLLPPDSC